MTLVSYLRGGRDSNFRNASSLWKGVSLLGTKKVDPLDWFVDSSIKKVGSGYQTSFWSDPWIGSIPLKDKFSRLFTIPDFPWGECWSGWQVDRWHLSLRFQMEIFLRAWGTYGCGFSPCFFGCVFGTCANFVLLYSVGYFSDLSAACNI